MLVGNAPGLGGGVLAAEDYFFDRVSGGEFSGFGLHFLSKAIHEHFQSNTFYPNSLADIHCIYVGRDYIANLHLRYIE